MKSISFLCLILLFGTGVWGKSFHFPDVEYAYAKMYYYNLGEIRSRPDYYIFSDKDGWASSIQGSGIVVSDALTANIEKLFLYGADGLIDGLSGCFIPRHGLVYFNEKDEPVASLSICFECQGVRMWTKTRGNIDSNGKGSVSRSEQQISTLQKFVENENILVSKNPEDYNKLMESKPQEEITIQMEEMDSTLVRPTFTEVKKWFKGDYQETAETKISAGGDKYAFGVLQDIEGSKFIFDAVEEDAQLGEAIIKSAAVLLPNGIHVGSTMDEVMNLLIVYDGPAYLSKMTFQDDFHKIVYHFEDEKVTLITINK